MTEEKSAKLAKDLKKLGKQIEAFEQNYLEDTMYYGYAHAKEINL